MSGGLARAALGPMPTVPTVTTPTMAIVVAPTVGVIVPPSSTVGTPRNSIGTSRSNLVREWTDGITAGGGVRQPTAQ